MGLIEDLSRAETIDLLGQRVQAMRQWQASITAQLPPGADLDTWGPVGEVLGLWLRTADDRVEWTDRLIRRLQGGAFRMADDAQDQ